MLGEVMESEIRSQPRLLAENSSRYLTELERAIGGRQFDMVLLAGRGSSDNAALFARYLIEVHLGIPVSLSAPSVITRFGSEIRYRNCLAVGISQSGEAPDVAEVLEHLRGQGHVTLAITNSPGSRLTRSSEHSLDLGMGKEQAVAATKTYTASLLAVYQMVRALSGKLPEPALPSDEWVGDCHSAASASLGAVLRSSILFALARGYSFCTAQETALKLMECALLPCKSYSTADFEHGPKALAGHGSAALVYGAKPDGIEDQGCLVEVAPSFGKMASSPIAEIIFGQWLALLASRARGLDPDDPRFLTKITRTL